ncbi:UNKNOWN [Stylonychia lemnae]|uniref:Uncharacterized protein n=1 Tax=Stylonychia lemnae TaxID=5949 RepID=A0A078A8Y5_STYLE|nr:UNKNOWN [Stylonychia lemnae]|eukprot:CDW78679.1 UNKNOWN [Stylonychia lemnae]
MENLDQTLPEEVKYKTHSNVQFIYNDKVITGTFTITTQFLRWQEEGKDNEICFSYKDFMCFGDASESEYVDEEHPKNKCQLCIGDNYKVALELNDENGDEDVEMKEGLDDCDQLIIQIAPNVKYDNATTIRVLIEECNMLNPDTEDSQDEEQEELFTKEYFDQMESQAPQQ